MTPISRSRVCDSDRFQDAELRKLAARVHNSSLLAQVSYASVRYVLLQVEQGNLEFSYVCNSVDKRLSYPHSVTEELQPELQQEKRSGQECTEEPGHHVDVDMCSRRANECLITLRQNVILFGSSKILGARIFETPLETSETQETSAALGISETSSFKRLTSIFRVPKRGNVVLINWKLLGGCNDCAQAYLNPLTSNPATHSGAPYMPPAVIPIAVRER
ncbi:hypothetical protein J6590_073477 [Homalodisca vitripennis]|nr:hypothetical protein J6590_073477 [Homalodisca vitripennis]